jgi:CheY-like chemotaxis protein
MMNDNMNPSVLVVDDDQESILLASTMLDYCEYRAITALNHDEAMKKIEEERPSALLLDLIMPDADSERLLNHLAVTKSRLPVILMSANEEQLRLRSERALRAGVVVAATLHKPFWIEPLLNALEAALPGPTALSAVG